MSTDLERRLRVTFDEMIPQLIEQVGLIDVVETPPAARLAAEEVPNRRWVGVGALAVAACVVAIAFVVGRDDRSGTIGGTDTTVVATTEVPAWYPLLRAAVPQQFPYLALVTVGEHEVAFEAIGYPDSSKSLRIRVADGTPDTNPTSVECETDGIVEPTSTDNPCAMEGDSDPFTLADASALLAALPAAEVLAAAQSLTVSEPDWQAVDQLLTAALSGQEPGVFDIGGPSAYWSFGLGGTTSTTVLALADVYPRPATLESGLVGESTFWSIDPSGYAVRVATSPFGIPEVVANRVLGELTGSSSVPTAVSEPAWYPVLRAAVPQRFGYLALTTLQPAGATFVAIEELSGRSLEISVTTQTDVPVGPVVVTCNVGADLHDTPDPTACAADTVAPFTEQDADAVVAAIDAAALIAAAQGAEAGPIPSNDVISLAIGPFTDMVGTTGDINLTYGSATDHTTIRLVAGVYPRPVRRSGPMAGHFGDIVAFWTIDPAGFAVRAASTGVPFPTLASVAEPLLDVVMVAPPEDPTSTTSTVVFIEPGGFEATYGPITLGDGTSIRLQVGQSGICTLLPDGQTGGCDGLTAYDMPVIVLWGDDFRTSLQTVYGIVQAGHSLSVTKGDGSPDTPVALTPPQNGWSAYAFQQPVGSRTTLVVTDAEGNNVDSRPLCC